MARKKTHDSETLDGPSKDHNLVDIKKQLVEYRDRVIKLQNERQEINDVITEIRSRVKVLGITKGAFDRGIKRFLKDPDVRTEEDTSDQIVCEAFGVPLNWTQTEMFEEAGPIVVTGKDAAAGEGVGLN